MGVLPYIQIKTVQCSVELINAYGARKKNQLGNYPTQTQNRGKPRLNRVNLLKEGSFLAPQLYEK
tara:strand:- start:233 stop:427 length:195 start_codon:yes stop_codon:yes gene_type:complete